MKLIVIYGPPAAGKFTVAKQLSQTLGYKLFHNHLTVDLVRSIFEFEDEQANRLSSKFRLEMIEEAAKADISLIFTFVYAKGTDDQFMKDLISVVEKHGGETLFVLLKCSQEELMKRVLEDSRKAFRKVKDPQKLQNIMSDHEVLSAFTEKDLVIDNTNLSPEDTAKFIVEHFRLSPMT